MRKTNNVIYHIIFFLFTILSLSYPQIGVLANTLRVPLPSHAIAADPCTNPANAILAENCKPGTGDWHITKNIGDIEGFASVVSLVPGEPIDFFINSHSAKFNLFIYRSGFYGGAGGRLVYSKLDNPGKGQPACHFDRSTGLVSCSNWSVSANLIIPEDWVSGVYLVKLVRADTGGENIITFVVREKYQKSAILFQLSVTTYQAYNYFGNKSLYSSLSFDYCPTIANAPRAVQVSLDRPNSITTGSQNSYFWTDYPWVYWLESQGYDVSYFTNIDTHRSGINGAKNELLVHRAFFSIGHDEYWTQEMRDAITAARDAGVHLGFFSSNVSYWRIRLEADPWTGHPDRVIVGYKTAENGVPDPSGNATTTWRDPQGINNPENSLIGVQYVGDNDNRYFPLRVTAEQSQDRLYRNTGLQDMKPGTYTDIGFHLMGWEWDAVVDNGHTPKNLEILASSPVYGELLIDAGRLYQFGQAAAQTTRYVASSGAIVFASATNQWGWGLAVYEPNHYIQQITYNLLADMGLKPTSPSAALVLDGDTSDTVANTNLVNPNIADRRDSILANDVQIMLKIMGAEDFSFGSNGGNAPFLQQNSPNNNSTPEISNLYVIAAANSAVVSWETNKWMSGQVWVKLGTGPVDWRYPGAGLGARPVAGEISSEKLVQKHAITISGLAPSTKYYYQFAVRDDASNTLISSEQTLETINGGPLPLRLKFALRPFYRQVRCSITPLLDRPLVITIVIAITLALFIAGLWFFHNKRVKFVRANHVN